MDQRLHRAATHARGHLTAQESSRRPGKEEVHLLGVEEPACKPLPASYDLDLIQEEDGPPLVPPLGMQAVVLLHHEVEVGGGHASKSLVFEVEIKEPLPIRALRQPLGQHLPEERRLSRSTHPDDRQRLAGHLRESHVPPRERRHRRRQRIDDLLPDELAHLSFFSGQNIAQLSFCKGQLTPVRQLLSRPSAKTDPSLTFSCQFAGVK